AVQKQLGLDLVQTKVPTPMLVVTGANEKPAPNPPGTAQALPPLAAEFEVADIKLAAPNYQGPLFQVQLSGRVEIHNALLRSLIIRAWGLDSAHANEVVLGPKSLDTTRFDITAKAPIFGLPPDAPPTPASSPFQQ